MSNYFTMLYYISYHFTYISHCHLYLLCCFLFEDTRGGISSIRKRPFPYTTKVKKEVTVSIKALYKFIFTNILHLIFTNRADDKAP